MNVNYGWVIGILIIVLLLIIWIIARNRKDQKDFEEGVNSSEIKPEKHEDETKSM